MKKFALIFSLFFSAYLLFAQGDEEIVVHLSTESNLSPLYLEMSKEKASFPMSYLQDIEKVLRFDLNHNGRTYVLNFQNEISEQLKCEKSFNQAYFTARHIPFVVKALFDENKISLFAYSASNNNLKGIEKIELSGLLASDRKKIHAVADAIYEAFFATKGIACARILFTILNKNGSDSNNWTSEVFESDYDGANLRQLTFDRKLIVTPTYVPEKKGTNPKNYLYVSYLSGQPKIFIGNLKDGKSTRLSYLRGNQLMPVVSPKRDLIAFISDIAGNPELFVQALDENLSLKDKPWQITSFPEGAQGSPTFSPDGKKIAFVSNKDGAARIYVTVVPPPNCSVKNLNPKLISKTCRENTSPAWSLDGTKLAYSAVKGGVRQIWLYDFQKDKEIALTDGPGNKESPSWAFNSEHLVFHVTTHSSSELYLLHIAQKESVKISSGAGEKRFACFEP